MNPQELERYNYITSFIKDFRFSRDIYSSIQYAVSDNNLHENQRKDLKLVKLAVINYAYIRIQDYILYGDFELRKIFALKQTLEIIKNSEYVSSRVFVGLELESMKSTVNTYQTQEESFVRKDGKDELLKVADLTESIKRIENSIERNWKRVLPCECEILIKLLSK